VAGRPPSSAREPARGAPGDRFGDFRAQVRIRHRAALIPATVHPATAAEPARGGRWIVETDVPVWAAAPGQAAVLYDGEVTLGGGRIARATVEGTVAVELAEMRA